MAKVAYTVETDLDPKMVWDALTEFGPRRAQLWPDLSASSFKVLEQGPSCMEVRPRSSGGSARLGGVGLLDSGGFSPLVALDRPVLTVSMDRRAKGFVGHIIHGIFQVTNGRFLAARTRRMLSNIRG